MIATWTMITHSSGQFIKLANLCMPVEENKRNSFAQQIGAVITYARRYSLQAALGISSSDDDTDAAKGPAEDTTAILEACREAWHQIDGLKRQKDGTAEELSFSFKNQSLRNKITPETATLKQLDAMLKQAQKWLAGDQAEALRTGND